MVDKGFSKEGFRLGARRKRRPRGRGGGRGCGTWLRDRSEDKARRGYEGGDLTFSSEAASSSSTGENLGCWRNTRKPASAASQLESSRQYATETPYCAAVNSFTSETVTNREQRKQ